MTRARLLIVGGAGLVLLSLSVNVPLNGALGLASTAAVSMTLLVMGVAGAANGIVMQRRDKGR